MRENRTVPEQKRVKVDLYTEAHLLVAAVRLTEHKHKRAAMIEDVCVLLDMSDESVHAVCRKLEKRGIVHVVKDPFSVRVSIADHLEIEKLPRGTDDKNNLAKELKEFQAKKEDMNKKIEAIQGELEKKRKSMFSDIEQKLKKEIDARKR